MIFPLLAIITIISILYIFSNLNYYIVYAEKEHFSTYENSIFKIKIDFPSNWIVQQYSIPGNIILFYDPPTKVNRSAFDRNFNSFDLFSNVSLGIFIKNITDLFPNHYNISLTVYNFLEIENLQKDPSIKINKLEEGMLSGEPAYKVDFKKFNNNYSKIWTKSDNIIYIIFYAYNQNVDTKLQHILQKMINSFEIIKNKES